ncbi:MAG: hypothetical protein IJR85_11265 [Synergistaceae bacterium]|nr:hypothetical protein [Synergistaceae bacterium]
MAENVSDMMRIELLLREHFARTDKQLAEMRAENAEFRATMLKEFNALENRLNARLDNFEEKINTRIDNFEEKVNTRIDNFEKKVNTRLDNFEAKTDSRFDKLEASVGVMQNDITGLKHDVAGLYHWDYWLLSIILVVFAMPQIVAGIKSLFTAIAEGVSLVANAFRRKNIP